MSRVGEVSYLSPQHFNHGCKDTQRSRCYAWFPQRRELEPALTRRAKAIWEISALSASVSFMPGLGKISSDKDAHPSKFSALGWREALRRALRLTASTVASTLIALLCLAKLQASYFPTLPGGACHCIMVVIAGYIQDWCDDIIDRHGVNWERWRHSEELGKRAIHCFQGHRTCLSGEGGGSLALSHIISFIAVTFRVY